MARARRPLKVRRIEANNKEEEKQIPQDILVEILSRIPASSLVRFKCVSKHWCSIICDPYFIDLHLDRSRKAHHHCIALLYNNTGRANFNRLAMLDEEAWSSKGKIRLITGKCKYARMTKSCNGLFCLYNYNGNIQLCNPTTQQHLSLPKPDGDPDPPFAMAVFHFGFHPVTKEYKILYHTYDHIGYHISNPRCMVFTLGTGSWHKISAIGFTTPWTSIAVNGAIYLLGREGIVSFDLEDEKFRRIPLPHNISLELNDSLAELEQNICFVRTQYGADFVLTSMDMWMLQDYTNNVWIHKYHFGLNQFPSTPFLNLKPKFLQKGKMWFTSEEGLHTYNIEEEAKGLNMEEVYPIRLMPYYNLHAYVESLAWVGNP